MYYTSLILVIAILVIYFIYISFAKKRKGKILVPNEFSKFIIINSNKEWLTLNSENEFEFTSSIEGGTFSISKKGNLIYMVKNLIYEIGLGDNGRMVTNRCPTLNFRISNDNELVCNEYLHLNDKLEFTANKCGNISIEYVDNQIVD